METFTDRAKAVYEAILAINPEDYGMQLLAKEVARGVMADDSGLHGIHLPIFGGLLLAHESECAPSIDVARAAANVLIGEPPHNIPNFTYIDCASFGGGHPLALAPLIGPQTMIQSLPRLHPLVLKQAHVAVKTRTEIEELERWNETFSKEFTDIFNSQDPLLKQIQNEMWGPVNEKYRKIAQAAEQRHAPYNTVIFFDNLEMASSALIGGILIPMLGSGIVPLGDPGLAVEFSDAIVFLAMQDASTAKEDLGFSHPKNTPDTKAARKKLYEDRKDKLLKEAGFGDLMRALGDQLFLIGDRTAEAERRHLTDHFLADIVKKFRMADVTLDFTPQIIDLLLQESAAKTEDHRTVYYDGRIRKHINKLVITALATALEKGELRRGSTVTLVPSDDGRLKLKVLQQGNGEPISAKDLKTSEKPVQETNAANAANSWTPDIQELDQLARATIQQVLAAHKEEREKISQYAASMLAQYQIQTMQQAAAMRRGGMPFNMGAQTPPQSEEPPPDQGERGPGTL